MAASVFGDRLPLAQRYAELLATAGVVQGVIGPREVPRLWQRHLLNCAVIEALIGRDAAVADVGSGAGLPGIVLALARPDLRLTLVEPLARRVRFLTEVVDALGLSNVEIVRARAEELQGARRFPVVTARAVAPLARLAAACLPLVERDGALLAVKGAGAATEVTAATAKLRRLGAGPPTIEVVGEGVVDPPTTVVRVVAGAGFGLGWDLSTPSTGSTGSAVSTGSTTTATTGKGRRR